MFHVYREVTLDLTWTRLVEAALIHEAGAVGKEGVGKVPVPYKMPAGHEVNGEKEEGRGGWGCGAVVGFQRIFSLRRQEPPGAGRADLRHGEEVK